MADDSLVFNAEANLAPSAPAPQAAPTGPPPLPNEPDASLIARAAVAEGDPNNAASYRNIGGVILNRAAKSGQSVADVLSEPGQFEAYGNGHIQSVDTSGPAYQAALVATKGLKAGDVPYDSFYNPTIVSQRGVKPPFDPKSGTMVGSQLFGSGYTHSPTTLTPDEERAMKDVGGGAATGPGAVTVGPQYQPATAAQNAAVLARRNAGLIDTTKPQGDDANPYAEKLRKDGTAEPLPAGAYVDLGGQFHPSPRSTVQLVGNALAGLGQGLGADTAASGARFGLGSGDPLYGALAQAQGGPSAFDTQQAALAGFRGEQSDFALRHAGEPEAQFGRFVGQALPATATAAVVPELSAPSALKGVPLLGRGMQVATNALRGTAAAASNVGANPDIPTGQQLAAGAVAGGVLPSVLGAAGKAGLGIAGVGSNISPEVRALADKAVNQYGIPLRGSQIAGVDNPVLAIKDSNLITAPGSGFAANQSAQRTAFTRAVASTFGADSDKLTPPVMSAARKDLGTQYDAFAASHSVANAAPIKADLGNVLSDASMVLEAGSLSPLERQVTNINDLIDKNGGSMPGQVYQSLIRTGSPLDRAMSHGDSNVRFYAGKIKDALDGAMMQTATPEEQAAFSNLNLQYKNLMTVKGLAAKAGITGEISPVQLAGVVNRSFDDRAFQGAGQLGDLADIGQLFMKQPPNSNTAQRAAEIAGRNWLPGLLAGAAGGEAVSGHALGGLMHDPSLGLQLAAGAAAAKGLGYAGNALAGLRNGPIGANLLLRPPGAVQSALGAARGAVKPVEIPLSALMGVKLSASVSMPSAVGANAQ